MLVTQRLHKVHKDHGIKLSGESLSYIIVPSPPGRAMIFGWGGEGSVSFSRPAPTPNVPLTWLPRNIQGAGDDKLYELVDGLGKMPNDSKIPLHFPRRHAKMGLL
jgi:hypothetical protein